MKTSYSRLTKIRGMPMTNFIAWWGAGLSTLLATVKLWELWRDRFRIEVGYDFTSSPEIGNEIHIRNLAGHPIILSFWELELSSRRWLPRKTDSILFREPGGGDIRVEPHSTHTLRFQEDQHFDWGYKMLKGRRIYIRLHIAGRKSQRILVYPPRQPVFRTPIFGA